MTIKDRGKNLCPSKQDKKKGEMEYDAREGIGSGREEMRDKNENKRWVKGEEKEANGLKEVRGGEERI